MVSEYNAKSDPQEILHTANWKSGYAISVDLETNEGKITYSLTEAFERKDIDKTNLMKYVFLSKSDIVERRVYLFFNRYKFDITRFARQDAKKLYESVMVREGGFVKKTKGVKR